MPAVTRDTQRRPRLMVAVAAALAVAVVGCGRPVASTDVASFARHASTQEGEAILRSIGIYRASRDVRRACSYVTSHFIKARFDGHEVECEYFSRQAPRALPRSGDVETVSGGRARVRIHELTSTRSVYLMALDSGTWKIDDIVGPPPGR